MKTPVIFYTLQYRNNARPPQQDLRPTWTALDSLLCGAFAGAVAKTVIAPLDRTKIIFQGKGREKTILEIRPWKVST